LTIFYLIIIEFSLWIHSAILYYNNYRLYIIDENAGKRNNEKRTRSNNKVKVSISSIKISKRVVHLWYSLLNTKFNIKGQEIATYVRSSIVQNLNWGSKDFNDELIVGSVFGGYSWIDKMENHWQLPKYIYWRL
jgi:hypothetical protein